MENLTISDKALIVSVLGRRIYNAKEQIKWNEENILNEDIRKDNNQRLELEIEELNLLMKKVRKL